MKKVIIITGPPGSGKSTISEKLAESFDKGVVINVDKIRHMIKGGYTNPWENNVSSQKQKMLAIKNACDLANNFSKSGFCVFIDDVITKKESLNLYEKFLGSKIDLFLLLPSKKILIERDSKRKKDEIMGKRAIELYEKFYLVKGQFDWNVIDNSSLNIEATVKEIKKYLLKCL